MSGSMQVELNGGMLVLEVDGVMTLYVKEQDLARSISETRVIILSSRRGS